VSAVSRHKRQAETDDWSPFAQASPWRQLGDHPYALDLDRPFTEKFNMLGANS
jgi:hypothetical protein